MKTIAIILMVAFVTCERVEAERYEDVLHEFLDLLENDGKKGAVVTITDSNVFIDTVLKQKMPALVKATPSLYPAAQVPEFRLKIKKNSLTNRDLKANLTQGKIVGLGTAVQRDRNCIKPVQLAGNTSVTCNLVISGINATFVAQTRGDNLLGTEKNIWVLVAVTNATARFLASAAPGKDGTVKTFIVENLSLRTTNDNSLDLNDERRRIFYAEIEARVRSELNRIFRHEYLDLLNRAVADTYFPRA